MNTLSLRLGFFSSSMRVLTFLAALSVNINPLSVLDAFTSVCIISSPLCIYNELIIYTLGQKDNLAE